MGRKKRQRVAWHRHMVPQATPEPHGQVLAGRFLTKEDLIQSGDRFLSAGKFYPVSTTIGMRWHAALPPMWRGPAPETPQHQNEHVVISTKHQELIDMVEMAGFTMPHQFNGWRRFFLDEKNFLKEAEHWLSMRLQGRFPVIETDVDKGLMRVNSSMQASHPAYSPSYNSEDDEDYWDAWKGWSGTREITRYSKWADPVLPLTPKIPAPSGTCAIELVLL